ncbi:family 43 glycosylhydrolase [Hyunsoonleella jejuensis]|nr:family 43 glycosylhydrolase [Hyunsoonleella jejuensis]
MNNMVKYVKVLFSVSFFFHVLSCKSTPSGSKTISVINTPQKPSKEGNPLVYDVGMADPHIKIFNNKAYLYATRDEDKTAKKFVMPDWKIWSSEDLIHWKLETTILPTDTYMGESKSCWATDAAYKNGSYYFYFSNGNIDTGVMIGDSPIGPFKDALGKPLLPKDLTKIKEYDPTVIIDDDTTKTPYIAFGHYRRNDPDYYYMIAKLGEDMVSLAEYPKEIIINGNGKVLGGNDKPNIHKKNGLYYLSAGSHYATSKNIYGPYTRVGNSGYDNKYGLSGKAHGNYFDWNNQSFHTWCHFHLGKDIARYRESYISYLHYKDNGEMVTDVDFLDKHFAFGVGQYDANWNKIEAEWYMKAEGLDKRESFNGGFEIQNNSNVGGLYFPNVYNLESKKTITFNASVKSNTTIEVRANNSNGPLLGSCKLFKTSSFKTYQLFTCNLANTKGIKNVYLKFICDGEDSVHLDWLSLK